MAEFKSFWAYFNKKDDDLQWITVNGAHIPIKNGESKASAVQRAFATPKKPTTPQIAPSKRAHPKVVSAVKKLYDTAPEAKNHIDRVADTIADKVGGRVAKPDLKNMERSIEKVIDKYKGDASKIKDIARNTIVTNNHEGFKQAVATLSSYKGTIDKEVISSKADPLGYSGANFKVKTPNGHIAEIQANTPEMIYAKEPEEVARNILTPEVFEKMKNKLKVPAGEGHKMYEEWRKLKYSDPTNPRRIELEKKSRQYYDGIRKKYTQYFS